MSEKKLYAFDSVRGLAAFAVVLHHLVLAFSPFLYGAALNPLFRVSYEGKYHVRVFFVLSGFVLSLSYLRGHRLQTLRSLAVRRYFRFLAPVAASVLFAYCLMAAGLFYNDQCGRLLKQSPDSWLRGYNQFQPDFLKACKQIVWTTYFRYSATDSYNNVLWTMSIELKGSFLVLGFLALCGGLRHRWAAYIVMIIIVHRTLGEKYCCFLVGIALCDLYVCGYTTGRVAAIVLIVAGLTLGGLTPTWTAKCGWSISKEVYVNCPWVGASLLLAGVAASSAVQRCLSVRPLVFLGKVSFPLYLVHLPVLYSAGAGVYCLLHVSLGHMGACAAASATTVIVSLALAWFGALTLEPFAIWSGHVVENWLNATSPSKEDKVAIAMQTQVMENLPPSSEILVVEAVR